MRVERHVRDLSFNGWMLLIWVSWHTTWISVTTQAYQSYGVDDEMQHQPSIGGAGGWGKSGGTGELRGPGELGGLGDRRLGLNPPSPSLQKLGVDVDRSRLDDMTMTGTW
jgi:hypothetical protein